jgi:hypothetical protein
MLMLFLDDSYTYSVTVNGKQAIKGIYTIDTSDRLVEVAMASPLTSVAM